MTEAGDRKAGLRRAITLRLEDVHRQYAALQHAMAEFGSDFDRGSFSRAFETADDLHAYNCAQAVTQAFTTVQNYVAELAASGAELAGLRGKAGPNTVRDLGLLRDHRIISATLCQRLSDAQNIRNAVQHSYPELGADDLHEAVLALHNALSSFVAKFSRWIEPYLEPDSG